MVTFLVKIICLQQLRPPQQKKDSLNLIFVTEFTEVAGIQSSNLLGGNPSSCHSATKSQIIKMSLN